MSVDPARPTPDGSEPIGGDSLAALRATDIAVQLADWGFVCHSDLPDGPGPAVLLIALRAIPTLRHFDPEKVDYWVIERGRGQRRTLTHASRMPASEDYSWGLIRLEDRLHISNDVLTFGGHLDASLVGGDVVAAFASPAPQLRRGGHSQGLDTGADAIGAFFGRMMASIDFKPGFEATFGEAAPLTRYAAFVADADRRQRRVPGSAWADDGWGRTVEHEAARLRRSAPDDWAAAAILLDAAVLD